MEIRRLLRWALSVVSPLGVILVALNIERLAEAHGWDLFLRNTVDADASPLWAAIASPWAMISALVVIAFTAGIWTEWLLKRREVRRNERLAVLGGNALALAGRLSVAMENCAPRDVTPLMAEVGSQLLTFHKHGFSIPEVSPELPVQS